MDGSSEETRMVHPHSVIVGLSLSRFVCVGAVAISMAGNSQLALPAEVEIRRVVHDEPETTVDKRDYLRFIHESVNTGERTEIRVVGLAQTTWVRNARLDDKVIFERFYQGRYVNRLPFAKGDLASGEHVFWPGDHKFTVAEDGTVTSEDPEFIIEGNVVRLKTYEVTLKAYHLSSDGRGVDRLAGLPNLTVREAAHASDPKAGTAAHRELIVPKRPGDHNTIPYPFSPLKLWLPAHTEDQGYLVHPIGLTFHVTADGVQPGAGGGLSIDALQIREHEIGIPLYRFTATGAAGTGLLVGKSMHRWNKVTAGSTQSMALYPQSEPYVFRIAEIGEDPQRTYSRCRCGAGADCSGKARSYRIGTQSCRKRACQCTEAAECSRCGVSQSYGCLQQGVQSKEGSRRCC